MIVVDSSVWIDHFNEVLTPQVIELRRLVREGEAVCVTGVVKVEILRGFATEEEADLVARSLAWFPSLELDGHEDYAEAARLYRTSRSAGVTIRNSADLLIAAPCIRDGAWLLHNDRDFDLLATCSELKIWEPRG